MRFVGKGRPRHRDNPHHLSPRVALPIFSPFFFGRNREITTTGLPCSFSHDATKMIWRNSNVGNKKLDGICNSDCQQAWNNAHNCITLSDHFVRRYFFKSATNWKHRQLQQQKSSLMTLWASPPNCRTGQNHRNRMLCCRSGSWN